jgi:hypothetical protein
MEAPQRHRPPWGVVSVDGIFWLAGFAEPSRGEWRSGWNPDAGSKLREHPGPRHSRLREPARARDAHGVGLELGALPACEGPEWLVERALGWRWQAPEALFCHSAAGT